jgi:hypothetical protein
MPVSRRAHSSRVTSDFPFSTIYVASFAPIVLADVLCRVGRSGRLRLCENCGFSRGKAHVARQPTSLPTPRTRPSICAMVTSRLPLMELEERVMARVEIGQQHRVGQVLGQEVRFSHRNYHVPDPVHLGFMSTAVERANQPQLLHRPTSDRLGSQHALIRSHHTQLAGVERPSSISQH